MLAASFERIHRSNLIGMDILPLRLAPGVNPHTLQLQPGDRLEIDADPQSLAPRCRVAVRIRRLNGSTQALLATAAVETQLEVQLLRDGGVIPSILGKTIAAQGVRARPAALNP